MNRTKLLATSSLAVISCYATQALAQEQASTDVSAPDIIVTGSRIARSGFDASTPVAVSNSEDIKLSGAVNIERALQELPQVAGGSNAFNSAVTGTGGGYSDINLRGLGSARNLVLVNGRRYAIINAQQITDTNTIPSSLIERTEVVTGGSSAVYGSDAITGVVNFILKDHFEGVEGRAQVNMYPHSTTPTYNFDLTLGTNFADDRGNIAVSLNYLDRAQSLRGDYKWARYSYALGEGCIVPGSGTSTVPGTRLTPPTGQSCQQAGGMIGYIFNGSADIPNGRVFGLPAFGTNPAIDAAYTAAGLTGMGANGFTFNDSGTAARPYVSPDDSYNLTPPNSLQALQQRYMVNSFAHFDFSEAATLYGELHYSHNKVYAQIAPANYNAPTLINVNNPYLTPGLQALFTQLDLAETGARTVTHGSTNFTTTPGDGIAVVSVGRRFADLAPRASLNTRDVFRTAIGVRGKIGDVSENAFTDLKYDVYYTYSHASEDIEIRNGVSKSKLQQNLLMVNGAPPVCNEFGQNLSDACRAAIGVNALAKTQATLQVVQANLTGNAVNLPAGPLGFSFGLEWRKTSASFKPDDGLATGDVAGFSAGLPTDGSVSVKELFGEVRIPLIHDTPFIKELTANAGFRGSDYSLSGVGTVWTYFYGADWRVNSSIALRGQYQRAIRAPSVGELYGGNSTSSATIIDPCSSRSSPAMQTSVVRALCVATGVPTAAVFTQAVQPAAFVYAQSGGNPNLAAEKANTYTAGIVITPTFVPRLSFSVDYFDIDVEGAIGQLGGGVQSTYNLCYYVVQDANSEYCQAVRRSAVTGESLESDPSRILNANTGALKTRGIDFAVGYNHPLNLGFAPDSSISLRSNFTRLLEWTSIPVEDLPVKNECLGSYGATCGEPKPNWRGSTRITWNTGTFSLSLRHRYIGPVTVDRYILPLRQGSATAPSLDSLAFPKIKAQNYFDLSFNLDVSNQFELYGGANNIFNRDMPSTSGVATYDPMGTELFLGIRVKY